MRNTKPHRFLTAQLSAPADAYTGDFPGLQTHPHYSTLEEVKGYAQDALSDDMHYEIYDVNSVPGIEIIKHTDLGNVVVTRVLGLSMFDLNLAY